MAELRNFSLPAQEGSLGEIGSFSRRYRQESLGTIEVVGELASSGSLSDKKGDKRRLVAAGLRKVL